MNTKFHLFLFAFVVHSAIALPTPAPKTTRALTPDGIHAELSQVDVPQSATSLTETDLQTIHHLQALNVTEELRGVRASDFANALRNVDGIRMFKKMRKSAGKLLGSRMDDDSQSNTTVSEAQSYAQQACALIWRVAECNSGYYDGMYYRRARGCKSASSAMNKIRSLLGSDGGTSLGVTLEGGVNGGGNTVEAGAELGIALDKDKNKACYVGICGGRGVEFPPFPSAGGAIGLAFSYFKQSKDIPGTAYYFGVSGSVGVGGAYGVGLGLTAFASDGKTTGFGIGANMNAGTPTPSPVSLGFSAGKCRTGTYWKPKAFWVPLKEWGLDKSAQSDTDTDEDSESDEDSDSTSH